MVKSIFILIGLYSLLKILVACNNLLWGFHGEAGAILQIILDSSLNICILISLLKCF